MAAGLGVADAGACWPFVRARGVKAGFNLVELDQLMERCKTGRAVCLASPRGVVVVTARVLGPIIRLVVLLAVSDGAPGAFREHEDEMVQIAREFGAQELGFETPRRGWGRMLGKHWALRDGMFIRSV